MENMQTVVDQGPRTEQYFSDAFPVYESLVYYPGKYTVEWDNAELRHYLARLFSMFSCTLLRFAIVDLCLQLKTTV
jgi:IS1 family transposase